MDGLVVCQLGVVLFEGSIITFSTDGLVDALSLLLRDYYILDDLRQTVDNYV